MMERVAIKVTLEREVWLRKDVWEEEFGKELPLDEEELEMLEDECLMTRTKFKSAEVLGESNSKSEENVQDINNRNKE